MAEMETTQYDMYKQLYFKTEPLKPDALNSRLNTIGNWYSAKKPNTYFMLLCRERNDYTIIHLAEPKFYEATQELKEVLDSRGTIVDMEYVHGLDSWQCWVKNDIDAVMYMLFPCDDFVVEVD